jgi:putative transcriptional regulator
MSFFDDLEKSLNEVLDYEQGKPVNVKRDIICVAEIPDFHGDTVRAIRKKRNLTQKTFSDVLGVSLKTVEAWESGKNTPSGPAQRVLQLMDKDENFLNRYSILTRS